MPRLAATGKEAQDRWEKPLCAGPLTLGRIPELSDWATPWDNLISRKHAVLTWREGSLHVRRHPNARNPIIFQGEQVDDFRVGVGEQFVIGDTVFKVLEDQTNATLDLPTPISELSLDEHELRMLKFADADERIDVLAALPGVIRNAPSDVELGAEVLEVLLRGIPRAEVAAVVWSNPAGAMGNPEVKVHYVKALSKGSESVLPSQRLIVESLHRRRQSVMHLWQPGELRTNFTPNLSFDWAICSPLPDDPSPGWALYLVGRLASSMSQVGNLLQQEVLKGDMKFAGLVADVYGALRQVLHLQRRETQLAIFLPEPVRAAIDDRDVEEVLAPREADTTVLFCDLRGSCRIADEGQGDLTALWEQMSEALGIMTSGIIDQGGVIGDFQGDAAMGFWGWPLDTPDQVERAARAALVIRRRFIQASRQKGRALAGFNCGIGIATGRSVAGRLGTSDQAKVSVFGPRVNLAARLESMTKMFRVPILIDEATTEKLRDSNTAHWARCRRVALVRPFGMSIELTVSELLPPAVEPGSMPERDRRNYEAALDAFINGEWGDARELLQRLPGDGPSNFLSRFMSNHQDATPTNWNGVIVLDNK